MWAAWRALPTMPAAREAAATQPIASPWPARPGVGPAVAGAGGDSAGAAIGERVEDEQRALVHRPRPGRGPGAERPRAPQPAAVSRGGVCEPQANAVVPA